MQSLSRQARVLLALATASLAAIALAYALAYALAPTDRYSRALVADFSWTWTMSLALVACGIAWRHAAGPVEKRTWLIVGLGCAAQLVGQFARNYYELVQRVTPPYPSLADIGYLSIYLAFVLTVLNLLRSERLHRIDPEVALDIALVTFTAGALAWEFLLYPLVSANGPLLPLLTSMAWSTAGVGVLLMLAILMIRRSTALPGHLRLLMVGFAVYGVANIGYAILRLRGTYQPGGILDLGWDVGLLAIVTAAALAPERGRRRPADSATLGSAVRIAAVLAALAGIALVALKQTSETEQEAIDSVLVAVGVVIVGARFAYSLRADRRYEGLLENEVAHQTRSLMDSLAAAGAAERNLRLLMDSVPDAIVVLDAEGRMLDSNEPARVMAAAGAKPLQGRRVFEFLDAEAAAVVREKLKAAFRGEVQRFEVPFRRDDGSKGISSVLYAAVREGLLTTKILVLARDITDQRRTESQLQQTDKLAALGQLVSGVAHEINNPAAIISGFAQTLLLDDLKPEHRETLQMIHDEATRIGRITSNLLAFARAGAKQRRLVDLNDIVRRTFALRSYHLSTLNIAATLDLDPQDPRIWADASELQQLLLNLLINAEQALMTVELPRKIALRSRATEKEVRLEIADSGPGIAPDIRSKIFDPFFTTKPEGVGTGLGLSICYGIAQELGGRIWVESEPGRGRGATFCVVLPRDPRNEIRPVPESPAPAGAAAGPLSVLILDDESALRNALLRFLNRRGIQGRGVGDGTEALRVLKHHDFDVIISDVRMPGMGGREFIERLRQERPDLLPKLVFSTGDTFAPDTAALIKQSGVPTVTKPFDFAVLEQVVREVAARSVRLA